MSDTPRKPLGLDYRDDPKDMEAEFLCSLAFELYARNVHNTVSENLHNRSGELCEEVLRRLRENAQLRARVVSHEAPALCGWASIDYRMHIGPVSFRVVNGSMAEAEETISMILGLERENAQLRAAIHPFTQLVKDTNGRIPVERLSLANWHDLTTILKD